TIPDTAAATFEGSCFYFPGAGGDKGYKVTVPAPTTGQTGHDIIATTGTTATFDGMTMVDTYVYVRTTCGGPGTEIACDGDIGSQDFRSTATAMERPAGNYFVFVGTSAKGMGTNFTFNVTLRPVLATGQTCDPMGVTNRCHANPCPSTGTAVCP